MATRRKTTEEPKTEDETPAEEEPKEAEAPAEEESPEAPAPRAASNETCVNCELPATWESTNPAVNKVYYCDNHAQRNTTEGLARTG